jgi:polyisoprenoid-binding protein YceI
MAHVQACVADDAMKPGSSPRTGHATARSTRAAAGPTRELAVVALFFAAAPVAAQAPVARAPAWQVAAASVTFEVRNAGLSVHGSFDGAHVRICFDPARPERSSLSGEIDPGTIRTGIGLRDRHLQRHGWFDVAKYGWIEMRSKRLWRTATGFAGAFTLRIRDVERSVEVPFVFERSGEDARLAGELTIDRLDYGLGKPSVILSDEVAVRVDLSLIPTDGNRSGSGEGRCRRMGGVDHEPRP